MSKYIGDVIAVVCALAGMYVMHFAAHIPNNWIGIFLDCCILMGIGIVVENAANGLGRLAQGLAVPLGEMEQRLLHLEQSIKSIERTLERLDRAAE